MDYLTEGLALGVDLIILGTCLKQYYKNKNAITMVQGAPLLPINGELKEIVETHPDRRLAYVSIRGTVKALGSPIASANNPSVAGVVQLLRIKEHVIQRSATGFWSDSERVVQEVHNVMPFALRAGRRRVEVADALAAEVLDMDTISDVFAPSSPSVMDHIWGFFSGIRQRGVQSTEQMLREGTTLTGIGELVCDTEGNLKLQPPSNGAPFFLTNMQVTSLIKKLDGSKKNYRLLCLLFGTIGLLIGGLIVRKYWRFREDDEKAAKRREQIEKTRRKRRQNMRDRNLSDSQLCVVCKTNPIEVILLPCGHVCLCEDCSIDISANCPICRAAIEKKTAAYVV